MVSYAFDLKPRKARCRPCVLGDKCTVLGRVATRHNQRANEVTCVKGVVYVIARVFEVLSDTCTLNKRLLTGKRYTMHVLRYDKNHPSAVALDAFGGAQMEPHVFREQLKRVSEDYLWYWSVTDSEVDAVCALHWSMTVKELNTSRSTM